MFDTHCHLNFKRYKKNLAEVIQRAQNNGIQQMVVPGTDVKSSIKAVEIAREYSHIYAAVGIHPHHAYHFMKHRDNPQLPENDIQELMNSDLHEIEKLLSEPLVVAVGEVGMDKHTYQETVYEDYSVSAEFLAIQRNLLKMQMKIAIKYRKSLILHNREAKDDLLLVLSENWDSHFEGRAVFHCCEPDPEILSYAQTHNMYIGVDGDVTYDREKQSFIQSVPLDMLVIETDSPYILPEPLKSERKYPNEPAYVRYVAEKVARIKDVSIEHVIEETTSNGNNLFQLA